MIDEIERGWEEIVNEIIKIEAKEEHILLCGDLNRHIGDKLVANNHPKVSHPGRLLLDLLEKESLTLVNSTDKVINGPFTRFEKSDSNNDEKKSLLDKAIISTSLLKYINKLEVDKELN